jgi:ligand-binding sensor domain-containing protein
VKYRLLYTVFAVLCLQPAFAQFPDLFKTLTTRNGLSYNLINSLFQDREGYIWVGTFNGLNRYDGSRFVVFKYDRNDPRSIAHNNIAAICEDRNGDIWTGTANGVSRYNKLSNDFTNYLLETGSGDDSRNNDISNILCDREGTIWVSSLGGLYEYLPGSNSFKAYKHDAAKPATISSNRIHRNSMVEDPRQPMLWIGTNAGLNCFDTRKKVFYSFRNNPEQLSMYADHDTYGLTFDRDGQLLFGDYVLSKLVYYSTATKAIRYSDDVVRKNPKNQVTTLATLFVDKDNNTWASAWNYTIQFRNNRNNAWYPLVHDEADRGSIGSDFFWSMLQAKDGSIYVGGMYGLSVYNPVATFYSVYKPVKQVPALQQYPNFNSIAEDATGKLWLANDGLGLFSYDFNTGLYEHYPIPAGVRTNEYANYISRIVNIGDELWLCTVSGIYIFNPVTKRFRLFDEVDKAEQLTRSGISWCHKDKRGIVWFNAKGKYLYRYDPATRQHTRYNPDSVFINPSRPSNIKVGVEDAAGNMWFGAYSGRLYKYDPRKDSFSSYMPPPNQRPAVLQRPINDLYADGQGKIWLATEGAGLVRFDPANNTFKSWMETDGLVMDVCNRILPDKQGKIWVGSYEGYTVFDPQHEQIENPWIDYGQRENNFLSGAKCALRNGKLIFSNMGNFIVIDPAEIAVKRAALAPVISGITVFEKPTPLYQKQNAIHLSWKENFFTIDFSTFSSQQKTAVEYAYRLVQYDKDWVISNSRNFASYTGVKGGNYQFEVKARYKDDKADAWSQVAVLTISIAPPFWETWWFRSLVVLLVIAAIVLVVKLREKRLVKEQKVKSEFRERISSSEMKALRAQMNPHFLYNSLNAIRLFVLQNDSDNAEKYLVKFARLMRLILDNSRQDWVNLGSEIEQLQLYLELEQLRFDNKFYFSVQVDPSLHRENTSVPPMIIQPYIENSILHGIAHKAGKGMITVTIQPSNGHLECVVDDNGVGRIKAMEFSSRKLTSHKSVGLRVTQERLQLISERTGKTAGVEVVDKYDELKEAVGTKVIITLPLVSKKG